MAQSILAFPERRLTVAPLGAQWLLGRLPADWTILDDIADVAADRVIVGPNGVFTVVIDPDPRPAFLADDGLYRAGARVTTPVKRALSAAFALRQRLERYPADVFPYPLLALDAEAPIGFVGRLRVVPASMLAEAVWTHPGRPLLRSQRRAVIEALAG
jgi:hypothetical protein